MLYAYYARKTLGALEINKTEDGMTRHLPMDRMWGLLKDFELSPLFCSMNTLKSLVGQQQTDAGANDSARISLNGYVKVRNLIYLHLSKYLID